MGDIKSTWRFEDNSKQFINSFKDCGIAFLHEAKDSLVSATQRNTPRKTKRLANSFGDDSFVDERKLVAYVGSSVYYSIYVERGTGEYAINGDGRKGGWVYRDSNGKRHFTYGMKPKLMLYKAYLEKRKKIAKEAGKHYARLNK